MACLMVQDCEPLSQCFWAPERRTEIPMNPRSTAVYHPLPKYDCNSGDRRDRERHDSKRGVTTFKRSFDVEVKQSWLPRGSSVTCDIELS